MKFLQTELQIRNKNINHYDFYYTVNKIRDDKEIMNDGKYEND